MQKIQLMQKYKKNSEKFRIDGSFIFIASAFHPVTQQKVSKNKMLKNSINVQFIPKFRKCRKIQSIKKKLNECQKCRKIQK
jgi:hypothetical protein